jgi:hypothetical protein
VGHETGISSCAEPVTGHYRFSTGLVARLSSSGSFALGFAEKSARALIPKLWE